MTQPAAERLIELLAINRAIAAASDYPALLRLVAERSATFIDAELAMLLLADESGDATIVASVGLGEARARSFRAVLDERIGPRLCEFIGCVPDKFLAAPVVESGTIRGILAVYRRSAEFTDADAAMLSALADQVAIALANVGHVRRLENAIGALRDADRRKDEFLGMLSHELRNPLAPIRTAIYLLSRVDPQSESASRARLVIQRQTDHLTRLIDDLLDVTRIARGKITLRRERLNVIEVVRRASEDHRSMLSAHGLTFTLDVPPDAVWVEGDPTRIAQVVGNLLQNAAKFTQTGGQVFLTVRTAARLVEISVRDTGAGIEPELLDRLFEPFVQSERSLARTAGGLGLGLALVKGVVELHGGTAHVISAGSGQGAEFLVRLPLAVAPRRYGTAAVRSADRVNSRRVLVVDDNRDAAESLAELVALFGHSVEVAYDGASAIEMAQTTSPDVVLCDIGLPGINGYEVARRIRARASDAVRLIAVSGYAQPDDVKKAVDAGFDAHIAKPPDPAVLDRLLS